MHTLSHHFARPVLRLSRLSIRFIAAVLIAASIPGAAFATPTLAEALDLPATWTSTGAWTPQETESIDGSDAVTGIPGPKSTIRLSVPVTGPGVLRYSFRCTTLAGPFDISSALVVSVDGAAQAPVIPLFYPLLDTGWQETAVNLPAGSHVVEWKVANVYNASPFTVHLDQIWLDGDARPRFVPEEPVGGVFGEAFSWTPNVLTTSSHTVAISGLPPGLAVSASGAVEGTPTEVGRYTARVTVSNAGGQHVADQQFIVRPALQDLGEALDTSLNVSESHSAAPAWKGGTGVGVTGSDAAWVEFPTKSSATAILSVSVHGPGVLRYRDRNDEISVDRIQTDVRVVGGALVSQAGPFDVWTDRQITIPAGPQTVTWTARRQVTNELYWGLEVVPLSAYVDDIRFEPTTIPPQSTYSAWQTAWNVVGLDPASDGDGDGLALLLEYATGGDPYTADPGKLPVISVVDDHLTIDMPKASTPTDLLYFVQGSKTLAPNSWTTSTVEVLDEDETHILARYKKTITEEPVAHLRVRVLIAP